MAKHGRSDRGEIDERAERYSALVTQRAKEKLGQDPARSDADERYPGGLGESIIRNARYIVGVAVVVLVVMFALVFARNFLPLSPELEEAGSERAEYVSPYDWTKLERSGGRYAYVVDGETRSRLGIDVSENQHEIDWEAVAQDGVEFAMIRLGYRGATEGNLHLDERYWANLEGARNQGLEIGVYFFSQANTVDEAVEEADYVLGYLGGAALEYPIAFDTEESVPGLGASRTAGLTSDEMTAIAEAFCARVEQAGYRSLIYGNANDLARYRSSTLNTHDLWWAEYGMPVPTAKIDMVMWQYSNSGEVAGIPVAVDMNIDLSDVLGFKGKTPL